MHRVDDADYVTSAGKRLFKDSPIPGTLISANSLNAHQEEIARAIEAAGITLSASSAADTAAGWNQLTQAIQSLANKQETINAVKYNSGALNAATLNAAIAAIGSDFRALFIKNGNWTINANVVFPDNVFLIMDWNAVFVRSAAFTVTLPKYFQLTDSQHFSGSDGFAIIPAGPCHYVAPEWFGASTASSDNTAAIQLALNAASASSGISRPGKVISGGGTWVCTGTITMPTRIVIWEGLGPDKTVIRHNPAAFSDFITGDTGGEGFVVFRDIRFCGNAYQTSKTRYLISYANFNENCLIENVQMRDSVGFLKITNGYLSTIRNLRCQSATPNAALAGISNSEWAEVWDDGHAPIHLRGMNGSIIDGLHLYRIASEVVGGVTPASPILIEATQALTIRAVQIEGATTYTDGGTYAVRQKSILVTLSVTGLLIDGWYMEANYSTQYVFHFKFGTQSHLRGITAYNIDAESSIFHSESLWDTRVNTGMMYKCRTPKLYKVVQAGFSVQGQIIIENFMVSVGNIFTEIAYSADAENVNDTYGTGAANLAGIADEDELTYSLKRICTPKRNTGLVVTAGSDPTYVDLGGPGVPAVATGHYIQITGGVFFNEEGRLITVKRPTGNSLSTAIAVFRLRPPTASKYYRLYIGEAGSPYLVESAGAFAHDRGNWIAQFRTDASTHIVKYSDGVTAGLDADPYNPRLSVYGQYIPNQNNIQITGTAVPTTGQWLVGDIVILTNPSADAVGMATSIGWVCTTAGTPGTWTKITDSALFVALLGKAGGQTIRGGTASGESLTLQSTAHATRGFVKFGGSGLSVYDETNDRLGLGKTAPAAPLHISKSANGDVEVGRFVNEDSTAASVLHSITKHYRLRGNGSASDRTAGYFRVRKEGNFDSAGAMDAEIALMPSIDETPTDTLSASATYGARCYRRLNIAKGADVASANDLTLGDGGNFFVITGTTTINRIAIAGWTAGAEVTLKTSGSLTLAHQGAANTGSLGRLNLLGSANVAMTANDFIKLIFDGTEWWQSSQVVTI